MIRALLSALLLAAPSAAFANPALERADIAFQMAQTLQNSSAAQAVRQIGLRLALKDADLEGLAIERRDILEDQAVVQRNVEINAAERRQQLDALDTALRLNEQSIAGAYPGFGELVAPRPLAFGEVQAALASDEALLQFYQGEHVLQIWVIKAASIVWHRVPLTEEQSAEFVALYRAGMGLDGSLRAAAPLDDAGGEADMPILNVDLSIILYRWLFGLYREDLADVAHLMIVPDKAWIGLPFATLLTDAELAGRPLTTENLRGAAWMMNKYSISVLPSTASLRVRGSAADEAAPSTLFAVGDPVFTGAASPTDVVRAAASGLVDVSGLAPLPGTRREVRAIAARFGADRSDILLGADATEAAVRAADLGDKEVIVFATHGLIAGELQGLGEPALALTPPPGLPAEDRAPSDDGLLTAGEIAEMTLSARWVVLSACNTAAASGEGAEGLSGLARAFFAAGAQALLVSHWPVRDDAAARLTSEAFAALAEKPGMRRAEAMRQAMQALLRDSSDPTLARPASWAPFFVVGT